MNRKIFKNKHYFYIYSFFYYQNTNLVSALLLLECSATDFSLSRSLSRMEYLQIIYEVGVGWFPSRTSWFPCFSSVVSLRART